MDIERPRSGCEEYEMRRARTSWPTESCDEAWRGSTEAVIADSTETSRHSFIPGHKLKSTYSIYGLFLDSLWLTQLLLVRVNKPQHAQGRPLN